MKRLSLIVFTLMSIAYSCKEEDSATITQDNISPQVQSLGKEGQSNHSSAIKAWIYDENKIEGYAGNYYFSTNNLFETVSIEEIYDLDWIEILVKDETTILFQDKNELQRNKPLYIDDLVVYEYTNKKKDKTVFLELPGEDIDPSYFTQKVGRHYYADPFFLNKNKGWAVSYYINIAPSVNQKKQGLNIFSIVNGEPELISEIEIPRYYPYAIYFEDNMTGWVLLSWEDQNIEHDKEDMYVINTTDGGKTWSSPVKAFDGNYYNYSANRIYSSSENNVILYPERYGSKNIIQSSNKGQDWTLVNTGSEVDWINDIDFPSEDIGYMSVRLKDGKNRLYKTNNKGASWTPWNLEENIVNIEFLNNEIGINFFGGILQITRDGGSTWKTLIRP